MLAEIFATPPSQWQRVTLPALTRQYRNPRVLETIQIKDYVGNLRQLAITELGHEEPSTLLTNQFNASVVQLITHAQRMLIENGVADAIRFFHLDALSSMVGYLVNSKMAKPIMVSNAYYDNQDYQYKALTE